MDIFAQLARLELIEKALQENEDEEKQQLKREIEKLILSEIKKIKQAPRDNFGYLKVF